MDNQKNIPRTTGRSSPKEGVSGGFMKIRPVDMSITGYRTRTREKGVGMHHKCAVFLLIFAAAVSIKAFTISGTVTTRGGEALPGTVVTLKQASLTAVTDSTGYFCFEDIIAPIRTAAPSRLIGTCTVRQLRDGGYHISLPAKSALEFEIFNAAGRVLVSVTRTAERHDHLINLPVLPRGLHVYRLTFNRTQRIFTSAGAGMLSPVVLHGSLSSDPAYIQANAAAFTDVLIVSSNGFLTNSREVTESDTAEIAVNMIPVAGMVTDIDGNEYSSVRFGTQVWLTENLRTRHYRDGTVIPLVQDSAAWYDLFQTQAATAACNYYENDTANLARYGMLYNWYAVSNKNLPPEGWRVPSDTDWTVLERYLDDTYVGGGSAYIAKSMAAQTDWKHTVTYTSAIGNNLGLNNVSGFSALPSGNIHPIGAHSGIKKVCSWYSSTEADSIRAGCRGLNFMACGFLGSGPDSKYYGFGVRLVRDLTSEEEAEIQEESETD